MQRVRASKKQKRAAFWEYAIYVLAGLLVFLLAGAAHNRGIAEKWVTALLETLFPFCLVIFFRRKSFRWSFWIATAICLLVHCVLILLIFQYALVQFQSVSPLLWLPIGLIEVVLLLIMVKRLEEKITGRRETIKLSF